MFEAHLFDLTATRTSDSHNHEAFTFNTPPETKGAKREAVLSTQLATKTRAGD